MAEPPLPRLPIRAGLRDGGRVPHVVRRRLRDVHIDGASVLTAIGAERPPL